MKRIISLFFLLLSGSFFVYIWAQETELDLLNKAGNLLKEQKYREAINLLESVKRKNPDSIEINLTLGLTYIHTEQYSHAEDCFLEVLRIDPNSISAYYSLAMLYEKNRRFQDAISQWYRVLNITEDKSLKEFAQKHIKWLETRLRK